MPTNITPTKQSYPKRHLFAASGIAALLCLTLLVYPSREVEAKKTFINIELEEQSPEQVTADFSLLETPQSETAALELTDHAEFEKLAQELDASVFKFKRTVTVKKGDTLSTIFSDVGLGNSLLHSILAKNKEAQLFTRIKEGQELTFEFDDDQSLKTLSSKVNVLETIFLEKQGNDFSFRKDIAPTETIEKVAKGTIKGSLFGATNKAGLPRSLAISLSKIFEYDIDFAKDIRSGDTFEVVYEAKTFKGQTVGAGNILSARFTNRGKTYTAVRYTDKKGNTNYYAADGSSLRKAFIRTPVEYARISSRFSNGRKHPILNKIRAHKGVDYAAPRGTPIKATGDGRVSLAGRKGGYGNTVVIKHGKHYQTLYAHMQGFAKGIRAGSNVKQGQIIGYIGTTGLSTGPHLHYEFQVNGVHVDPLSQKLPTADPIPASERQRFAQYSKPLLAKLDGQQNIQVAMNKQ
ncbi:peptidoglycan DD-metalloendopeptidase family protein [Denitrificimonas sp. JX-1]|uniref:Peptidoglycan DD-metalloendopeptidase family protein n=1 Tax=Denitrificimonas halotolerans TaxID=3098930 RepID=A0ABU5GT97_9GAMM|nr:peptidoglycan DD-metalloendopeptidase family protein [Denitrificimonas sp. JX-1]MDY7219925.1 peptidoglycan DD-metalloendopeptidase family protein [Denitrificimonas sp. JX-1]